MAVWQFDLDFVDAESCRQLSPEVTVVLATHLARALGPSLPMLESWSYFGDKHANRIDVIRDKDGSAQVQARVDARAAGADVFIVHVCEAAAAAACMLLSEELETTLEPKARAVTDALQRSAAWRFALDPASFRPEA